MQSMLHFTLWLMCQVGNSMRVKLTEYLPEGQGKTAVFFNPHDDDANIGASLMILLLKALGYRVVIVVLTDGSQGYTTLEDQIDIKDKRYDETLAAYSHLGIGEDDIIFLGYPDCNLWPYRGKRYLTRDEMSGREPHPPTVYGSLGIQAHFTLHLRDLKPSLVFVPTWRDLHPDHEINYKELAISLFHAMGTIWPEFVKGEDEFPRVFVYPVYCRPIPRGVSLESEGVLRIFELEACEAARALKAASIGEFGSQGQIKALVSRVLSGRGIEHFLEMDMDSFIHDPEKFSQEMFGVRAATPHDEHSFSAPAPEAVKVGKRGE